MIMATRAKRMVPQRDTLDEELTVRENILVYGRYFGLPKDVGNTRADELLEFAQLSERASSLVEPRRAAVRRDETTPHHRSIAGQPTGAVIAR